MPGGKPVVQLRATYGAALLRTHRALLKSLHALRAAAQAATEERLPALLACLDTTRDRLAEHFRFEEQNGYLASVLEHQPHLERAVRRLAEEHSELLRCLDELRTEARARPVQLAGLRHQISRWIQRVARHERSEDVLVQDAFIVDLNGAD
jgi:hypothetical protein